MNFFLPSTVFLFLFAASTVAYSAEITTGRNDVEKLAARGQTTTGCPEKLSSEKEVVVGNWLALTDSEIVPTKLFVVGGKVISEKPAEKYYFKDIPVLRGPIGQARTSKRDVNTAARTEYDIELGKSHYRFIEWGAWGFALITLSPSGREEYSEVYGSESNAIPHEAYEVTTGQRDEYEPGTLQVLKAADFNGDGVIDLLLKYWSKEAGGLKLWLSDPKTGRHGEPFVSPTEYSDCE
jgi:hypothetical protein